jgi:hypothetical protein
MQEKAKPRKRTKVKGATVLAFRGRFSSMRRMLTTRTEWAGRLSASLGVGQYNVVHAFCLLLIHGTHSVANG